MSEPIENPYKKGKSKLIASFMLEDWSNDKIFNHIHDNKLDQQFSNPVVMENIYQVRTKFNQLGLTDKMRELKEGAVVKDESELPETPEDDGSPVVLYDSKLHGEVADPDGKNIGKYPPVGRPEWDLLTTDQINDIKDPQLRTLILEYRSYREKIKQEVTPEYATSEQFDNFKTELQNNLQDFDGRLNDLKESISDTIVETFNKMQANNPSPEIAIADLEEIADVTLPSMDLETENPLEGSMDSVIELDDAIISKKTVGFTPKSLMLFSLTRKKGFRGNFADFVNSCIDSALKGRNFKLTLVEDVE